MKNLDFEWLTDEFMLYCRSTQLREKTMSSYEQTLHLFGRWLADKLKIYTVDKITENVIRRYIDDLQTRGKYTFYVNDLSKKKNYPDRRRDYRKPVSVTTINNYIRNIRVFFNWIDANGRALKSNDLGFLQDTSNAPLERALKAVVIMLSENNIGVTLQELGFASLDK